MLQYKCDQAKVMGSRDLQTTCMHKRAEDGSTGPERRSHTKTTVQGIYTQDKVRKQANADLVKSANANNNNNNNNNNNISSDRDVSWVT